MKKKPQLYTLYLKPHASKRWQRIGTQSLPLASAIHYYQDRLIYGNVNGEQALRVVKNK